MTRNQKKISESKVKDEEVKLEEEINDKEKINQSESSDDEDLDATNSNLEPTKNYTRKLHEEEDDNIFGGDIYIIFYY